MGPPTSSPSAWPTLYPRASWRNWQASKRPGNDETPSSTCDGSWDGSPEPSHSTDGSAEPSHGSGDANVAREELARRVQERIERWLDQGMGRCLFKQASLAAHLVSAMHHFDDDRYELGCYVVMPNHAHVVVRPLMPEEHPLEAIVGSWKKFSSRRINRVLQQTGDLWQDESFDRILRDEEHLWRAIQYIGANPDKAGLPRESCPLWIRPQWVQLGWRFDRPGPRRRLGEPSHMTNSEIVDGSRSRPDLQSTPDGSGEPST